MRNFFKLIAILMVQFSFAQLDYVIKFSAESWGVTKDVVKIEEAVYFAADNPKAYSTAVYTFQNGKLQNLVHTSSQVVDVYKFEYNAKGNPLKYTSTVGDLKPSISSFIYDKKGRLTEITPEESSDFQYKYQYDSSGKLSSVEQYSNNKLSNKQVISSYKDDKNYNFIAEMYSSSDGKKISESNRQFVNGWK
jgi:YD repeat-containing protein